MTLPASGAISLGQVNTELSRSATAALGLGDSAVRALFGIASGAIDMNTGHGKSSVVNIALTISSSTLNYNIFNNKGGTYAAGKSNITLTINGGVVVGSSSPASYALDTGSGWTSGDTITIINNGYIAGCGGTGANYAYGTGGAYGGRGVQTYPSPVAGGPSLALHYPVSITNGSGYIYSGGGGGATGNIMSTQSSNTHLPRGGGGGAGRNAGLHGGNYSQAQNSSVNGGLTAGGKGQYPMGSSAGKAGNGGGLGANGGGGYQLGGGGGGGGGASGGMGGLYSSHKNSGAGHGLAIQRNGYAVTWVSGNTRVYGGIS